MRVNPILTWNYGQIWHFLRVFSLPYCPLYDMGYTSMGKVSDSKPNPALARSVLTGELSCSSLSHSISPNFHSPSFKSTFLSYPSSTHYPAYFLSDWSQERGGRVSKSPSLPHSPSPLPSPSGLITSPSSHLTTNLKAKAELKSEIATLLILRFQEEEVKGQGEVQLNDVEFGIRAPIRMEFDDNATNGIQRIFK